MGFTHKLLEVFVSDVLFAMESFMNHVIKVSVCHGQERIPDCFLEVISVEIAFLLPVEEVINLPQILLSLDEVSRNYARKELSPMDLAVAVEVHGVEELTEIFFVLEVGAKEFLGLSVSQIPVHVCVDLEKHLPELLHVFVDVASVSHQVLDTLSEQVRFAVLVQALEGLQR